jgi:hypothetical protein
MSSAIEQELARVIRAATTGNDTDKPLSERDLHAACAVISTLSAAVTDADIRDIVNSHDRGSVPECIDDIRGLLARHTAALTAENERLLRDWEFDVDREQFCTNRAESEATALRTTLNKVRALTFASDDGVEWHHTEHDEDEGEPDCPACWAASIRAIFDAAPEGDAG